MVHGSYGNNSKVPRRAVVVNVFQDGTASDSDETLLNGVPVVPKGQKIEVGRLTLSRSCLLKLTSHSLGPIFPFIVSSINSSLNINKSYVHIYIWNFAGQFDLNLRAAI